MEDHEIVSLYWKRDERSIRETEKRYGRYLFTIAYHILGDREDSRECVNDTYLRAWNAIPPERPVFLSLYLGKIARTVSIDRFRARNRKKRRSTEYEVSLSELEECISSGNTTEQYADARMLADAVNRFLRAKSAEERGVFIGRYYFLDSVREIASHYGISESKTKAILHRLRAGLRLYLEEEEFL